MLNFSSDIWTLFVNLFYELCLGAFSSVIGAGFVVCDIMTISILITNLFSLLYCTMIRCMLQNLQKYLWKFVTINSVSIYLMFLRNAVSAADEHVAVTRVSLKLIYVGCFYLVA